MGNTIETFLSHIHGDQQRPERDPRGAHGEKLAAIRQRLHHGFTTLKTEVEKTRNDRSLSETGKCQRLAELAKKQDLSFLVNLRTETEADVKRLRTLLVAVPRPTGDPVLNFLREQEIRNALKDKPHAVIVAAYTQAVKDGDHERVRALTEGPVGSLVTADIKTRVEAEHASTAQPAVFENFEQVSNLKDHLNALEVHATAALHALSTGA